MYISPLRLDRHPTCSFFKSARGKLYFRDFGTGATDDVVSFVQKKFGLSYAEAEAKLNADKNCMDKRESLATDKESVVFDFVPDKLENTTYWDTFKIPLSIAAKYCFLAKSVYRNETYWARSTKTNPIFIYKFISGHIKVYRPLAEKHKKWAGNADGKDVGGFFQLQKRGVLCFITSSIKDVMVLRQHGFPAICFNGETYGLAENTEASKVIDMYVKILKSRFKYVCLFLDNDEAGLLASATLARKHRLPYVTTGSVFKDISDYQKAFGVVKTFRHLKKKIRSQFKNNSSYVPF